MKIQVTKGDQFELLFDGVPVLFGQVTVPYNMEIHYLETLPGAIVFRAFEAQHYNDDDNDVTLKVIIVNAKERLLIETLEFLGAHKISTPCDSAGGPYAPIKANGNEYWVYVR